jgi:hypothetical protein
MARTYLASSSHFTEEMREETLKWTTPLDLV